MPVTTDHLKKKEFYAPAAVVGAPSFYQGLLRPVLDDLSTSRAFQQHGLLGDSAKLRHLNRVGDSLELDNRLQNTAGIKHTLRWPYVEGTANKGVAITAGSPRATAFALADHANAGRAGKSGFGARILHTLARNPAFRMAAPLAALPALYAKDDRIGYGAAAAGTALALPQLSDAMWHRNALSRLAKEHPAIAQRTFTRLGRLPTAAAVAGIPLLAAFARNRD